MFKPVIYLTKSDLACSQDRTTSFEFVLTIRIFKQSDEVLVVHLMGRFFFVKTILVTKFVNVKFRPTDLVLLRVRIAHI